MTHKTIAFIGAGNMSASIIAGLVKNGYPADKIIASNPSTPKLDALSAQHSIKTTTDNNQAIEQADVIILSVKPQMMAGMLGDLSIDKSIFSHKLFISIAAGLPVSRLEELLVTPTAVVRTMPNTPSLLGLGMTGLYASAAVSAEQKQVAEEIMQAVGKTVWVEEESGIDKITALAGSAPAYFFLFMEGMESKAIELGFSPEAAREIVSQVATGSTEMVRQNDISIAQLRTNVTSKGGTTAAALNSFNDSNLTGITAKAMDAAIARAEEMAKTI